jgi:protein TonB
MEGGKHLERELIPEPMAAPVAGSLVLHLVVVAGLVFYGVIGSLFHHNLWGSQGGGGAMHVSLVSSALPLPADQPVNQNVLATETPSKAPELPSPKEKEQTVDEKAIPILGKQVNPKQQTPPKTQKNQTQPRQDNLARYGEQSGSSMARSMPSSGSGAGPTAVGNSDFTSRFGWYVDGINRKMAQYWDKRTVDSHTPRGTRVYVTFTIHRDGSPTNVQVDRASGSPTLNRSCVQGVQRVDTFGALPPAYNQSTLNVSYYCEY